MKRKKYIFVSAIVLILSVVFINLCYQKEVVLDPPDQWAMRHSNKYNIPDPAKIE